MLETHDLIIIQTLDPALTKAILGLLGSDRKTLWMHGEVLIESGEDLVTRLKDLLQDASEAVGKGGEA